MKVKSATHTTTVVMFEMSPLELAIINMALKKYRTEYSSQATTPMYRDYLLWECNFGTAKDFMVSHLIDSTDDMEQELNRKWREAK